MLSEKSSSPRHRRRPLHTLCSSLFLPRPRPTTSRDPFRPRRQPSSGASSERRVRRVGVSLTRVCVCRAAWRRTVRNMCTIKYTQKCLLSLALSCLRPPFPSVARARIRGEYANTRVYVCTYSSYAVWVCFQHRNPRYRGFRVPDTRPPCSRSLNTISSFSRHRGSDPFSLFPPRAHNTCTSFVPRIRGMLLGDVRGRFYPRQMGFAGTRECRVNQITFFLSRERDMPT